MIFAYSSAGARNKLIGIGAAMIKAAIIGYGNIGKYALQAIRASGDMEISCVVSRSLAPGELHVPIVADAAQLPETDVVLLCSPSRAVPDAAEALLRRGISTVDCYDIHSSILDLKKRLDPAAKAGNAAAVISAGWDPGTDSVVRALLEAMAPKGITNVNFGPGMSMGHSVAARAIPGVKNALSMTIPLGSSVHRRMVYVELESGATLEAVEAALKADDYFAHDETHVVHVSDIGALTDMGHGVDITRKGVSGGTHNQNFGFTMSINNPALTAQIMVASARAVVRQQPGCYTLIEIPPIDLLEGNRDEIVRRMV